jgi:hypothetical protein
MPEESMPEESMPTGAAPSSSDRSGETLSATPAANGDSPPAPSTSLASPPPVAPSTSVAPTLPVDGETQHRVSSLAAHAGRPARAVESTPIHTDVGTHVAVDAARVRGPAHSPNDAGLPLGGKHTAMAHGGLSAGSSGSSGAGPLGIIAALFLIFLPRWFRLLVAPERWRTTVFLSLRERPG